MKQKKYARKLQAVALQLESEDRENAFWIIKDAIMLAALDSDEQSRIGLLSEATRALSRAWSIHSDEDRSLPPIDTRAVAQLKTIMIGRSSTLRARVDVGE